MLVPAAIRRASSPTILLAGGESPRLVVRAARRAFRISHRFASANGSSGGETPASGSSSAGNAADASPKPAPEATFGRRIRGHGLSGLQRSRRGLKPRLLPLPPANLSQDFLDTNVRIYSPLSPPLLPAALAEDQKIPKISTLFSEKEPGFSEKYKDLADYFQLSFLGLSVLELNLHRQIMEWSIGLNKDPVDVIHLIDELLHHWTMILDCAWHLTDALYPARRPEYVYESRPFWWYDVYKNRHVKTQAPQKLWHELSNFRHEVPSFHQFVPSNMFRFSRPQVFLDLPPDCVFGMSQTLADELHASPPPTFDATRSRRPITILALSGQGGSSIPEALGARLAHHLRADLIRLDAYDLSVLVGRYLGHDWAYAQSALSMIGFRAAEFNGKLSSETKALEKEEKENDEDDESDTPESLEGELERVKQGVFDCFTKTEELKVDKILGAILGAAELKSPSSSKPRPLIIQINDIVELSMIPEGAQLVCKLRALVDAAWQKGAKIAMLGISSSQHPSEEYQEAVQELASRDVVIARRIDDCQASKPMLKCAGSTHLSLQRADYFVENMRNIWEMLHAMNPQLASKIEKRPSARSWELFHNEKLAMPMFRDSILPAPEVYRIASLLRLQQSVENEDGLHGIIVDTCKMGQLRQASEKQESGSIKLPGQDNKRFGIPGDVGSGDKRARVNVVHVDECERRIMHGLIDKQSLRTTFADIRAPPETIAGLRLLTSISLIRPDALSYGVLSQDRMSGCLLYGPPGTGKTMLARAVAKESGANMLEITGASIYDKFVGETEKLIRAIFTSAKRLSPCVIFIDEADAIFGNREGSQIRQSHRESLNQFLREWDGLTKTSAFIMVATNRPWAIDQAALRRLPRKFLVDLPTREDRAAIMRLLLRGEKLDESVNIDAYAERTNLYSGSDLKSVCIAAALSAVEEENAAAALHQGPEPFRYPEHRVLRADHFEKALREIPANIGEKATTLRLLRKFDAQYGADRARHSSQSPMGFGAVGPGIVSMPDVRVRPASTP